MAVLHSTSPAAATSIVIISTFPRITATSKAELAKLAAHLGPNCEVYTEWPRKHEEALKRVLEGGGFEVAGLWGWVELEVASEL